MDQPKARTALPVAAILVCVSLLVFAPAPARAAKLWSDWFYPFSVQIIGSAGFTVTPWDLTTASRCSGGRFRAYVGKETQTNTSINWLITAIGRSAQLQREADLWGDDNLSLIRVYYETANGNCYVRYLEFYIP